MGVNKMFFYLHYHHVASLGSGRATRDLEREERGFKKTLLIVRSLPISAPSFLGRAVIYSFRGINLSPDVLKPALIIVIFHAE